MRYIIEVFDASRAVIDGAIVENDPTLAVEIAKRIVAQRGDLTVIAGVQVVDEMGRVIHFEFAE